VFVWLTVACNCVVPNLLWFKRVRASTIALFVVAGLVNVGMWLERFVIIAGSLSRDFLTSSWEPFKPSWVDFALLAGSLSFFTLLFLLLLRFVPFIPMSELKEQRRG
jgi:Ni/Fe-hydrogenase subunit HybB-like protein